MKIHSKEYDKKAHKIFDQIRILNYLDYNNLTPEELIYILAELKLNVSGGNQK